jgi:hypothetical protein
MKKTAALSLGIVLFLWFICFPVLECVQSQEAPKAATPIAEKAEKTPVPPPSSTPPTEPPKSMPVPATGASAQPIPSPASIKTPLNTANLAKGLDWNLFLVLFLTFLTGGIGGVVYELLILQGNIEWPHKPDPDEITDKFPYAVPKFLFDLGIFARIIIGAAAALAALLVLTPDSTTSLLAISLVAGSAGTSVFRSMQDRLLASLAQKDAANKGTQLAKINAVNQKALEKLESLKTAAGPPAPGKKGITGIGSDDLEEIEKLLREAKGMGS